MFSSNNSQVSNDAVFVEDIFSTYLYTGNGTSQTITNGIDLAGKGGMVWIKDRAISSAQGLFDTVSGATKYVQAQSSTSQNTDSTTLTSFNSNGFSLGSNGNFNSSASSIAAWTFRQQAKFFTVVSWTGNGANRAINHDLGSVPGCILIKCKSNVGTNWAVYHRSIANTEYLTLNTTDAKATNTTYWNSTTPTNTQFSLGTSSLVNANGFTYVAYLFAHDAGGFGLTGTDNVISCGSYTGTGANGNNVTLGYEPQWLLIKRTNSIDPWLLFDNMRGMSYSDNKILYPNYSQAEDSAGGWVSPTATGFVLNNTQSSSNGSGSTYIYIAIRRGPMKVPTSGTSVFAPVAYSGTGATRTITAGFPVDLAIPKSRGATGNSAEWYTRLIGPGVALLSAYTFQELARPTELTSFASNTGVVLGTSSDSGGTNASGSTYVDWNFGRAPNFFDEVCYTGDGTNGKAYNHNLTVVPELVIVKGRSSDSNWKVLYQPAMRVLTLSSNSAYESAANTKYYFGNDTIDISPTATQFTVSNGGSLNVSGANYVAYLFSTCAGVSKVGSYTGNGSSLSINCGFTSGARFVLIKRTDDAGSWHVFDTVRGMGTGNDPYLRLDQTAPEGGAAYDSISTLSSGFTVNQNDASNLNNSGSTYIFLAIA